MILQQYPHLSVPRGLYVEAHVQPLNVEANVVEIPETTYPVCSNETIDRFIEKVSLQQQRRKKGKPVKAIKSLKQTKKEKLSKVARNTKKRKY